jgi:hypothetical protein
MSLPNEQASSLGRSRDDASAPPPDLAEPTDNAEAGLPTDQSVEHILQTRLSKELDAALESPDPVAGLDKAVQTVADELSRHTAPELEFEGAAGPDEEIAGAIETLVRVALEMDDPVAALEEGTETLAEALTERDAAAQARFEAARKQHIDQQAAYRHARFHRVSELIDIGYGVDDAIGITNANEADIRARALAMGRDPMDPIYEYAVRNGYRGLHLSGKRLPNDQEHLPGPRMEDGVNRSNSLAMLVQLNDEAFAEATKGDRWQRLMRP